MMDQAVASAAGLHARPLAREEVPLLQAFFDANPAYFQAVNGRDALPDEARSEFEDEPPAHLPWRALHLLGLWDDAGALSGWAGIIEGFCDPEVWHLGLYIVATRLHGQGVASSMLHALEGWMTAQGARWLRLGVVAGNQRAERFWAREGFLEARWRRGVDTGGRVNDLRVLVKPLRAGDDPALGEYLARVPRDLPESTLP